MVTLRQRIKAPADSSSSANATKQTRSVKSEPNTLATNDNDNESLHVDYEAQRVARILANEAFLNSLHLGQTKAKLTSISKAALASKRTATAAKRKKNAAAKKATPTNTRRSSRQRGEQAANIQVLDERGGKIVTSILDWNDTSTSTSADSPAPAPPQLDSVLFDEEDDDAEGEGLRRVLGGLVDDESGLVQSGVKIEELSEYHQQLAAMDIADVDETKGGVEKLTPNSIYGLTVHPSANKLVVMAGDKKGHVGIWAVDGAAASTPTNNGAKRVKLENPVRERNDDAGDNETQQVLVTQFRPHNSTVNVVAVAPESPMNLLSFSYDGTVKSIDMGANSITTLFDQTSCSFGGETDGMWLQHGAIRPGCPDQMGLGFSNGWGAIVDTRSGKPTAEYCLHEKKVQTVSFGADHYMCTASLAREVKLWDLRKLSQSVNNKMREPVWTMPDSRSVNCAYFSPDGAAIVTVAQSNRITLITNPINKTSTSIQPDHVIKHNNQTGRWLPVFHAAWDPRAPTPSFAVGSLGQPRHVDMYSLTAKVTDMSIAGSSSKDTKSKAKVVHLPMMSDMVRSVQSRHVFHPVLNVLVCGNSSGRAHVFR